MRWLADIPSGVWAALLTPLLLAAAARAGIERVRPEAEGWIHLRRSVIVIVLGLVCLAMAVATTMLMVLAGSDFFADPSGVSMFLITATPLVSFFWYVVYAFLVANARFNSEGFEYLGLLRAHFVPWRDVRRIDYNGFWGPYASTSRGGFLVSMYFKGFQQFIDEAKRHGVEVDDGIYFERTGGY